MKKAALTILLLFISFVIFGQNKAAYVAGSPSDFEKLNLKPGNIPEVWEDGTRTNGAKGTYEWWYFDAHLNDGTTVVIVFYTKPFSKIKKGLIPFITINIDKPDGTSIQKAHYGKVDEFSASDTICDVIIGENYFRGDLKNYEIHFKDNELQIDAKIKRTTESWRPKTGHIYYGSSGDYFAWLVPVPQGETEIAYTYKGESINLKGSCYHDHNFGNENMTKLINHWYWSRAEIGPYNLIAAELISDKKYDNVPVLVFNLSKDGKTIADEGLNVNLYRTYGNTKNAGKKPLSDKLKFIYKGENEDFSYEYTLEREKNLVDIKILDVMIANKLKRRLAKLLSGFDGAYYRMLGTASLKVYKKDILIEEHTSNKAVWELMYFGKPYE